MSDLTEAAAEPIRFQHDGEEYLVSALTLGDHAEIERWAEQQVWTELKRRLADAQDESIKKLLQHRIATISQAEIRHESEAYIRGAGSNVKFMHLMLKHEHPELTEETCAGLMTTAEFNDIYAEVHNLKRLDAITELEQEFFGKILPGWFKDFDSEKVGAIVYPADFVDAIRKFWKRYQKELEPLRPPVEA